MVFSELVVLSVTVIETFARLIFRASFALSVDALLRTAIPTLLNRPYESHNEPDADMTIES
jgi:hypothetical protein